MNDQKMKICERFLASNKVLIVDTNSASRARLRRSLTEFGVNGNMVFTTSDQTEAMEIVKEHKPQLVLSDYLIRNGSGFDLFKEYKGHYPDEKNVICVLITSNIDQSTVAKAAEEDVDSFLIKPYTAKSLKTNLVNIVNAKINPSPYIVKIDQGKELLFDKSYQKAKELFEEACMLSQEPSLALFYLGQAEYLIELTDEAERDYKKGLDINKIHFKCQVGLYEILRDQKRHEEAYSVVRSLAKYFPANPERLAEVVRLCVTTEKYHDMLEYYNTFLDLYERPDELAKYLAAGLYIAGKYQLLQNNIEGAFMYFEKVAISFNQNAKVMAQILDLLIENNLYEKATKIFAKYPLGAGDGNFELFEYLINAKKYQLHEKIHKGEFLFNNVKKNYRASIIFLNALVEKGDKESFYKYFDECKALWPKISLEVEQFVT